MQRLHAAHALPLFTLSLLALSLQAAAQPQDKLDTVIVTGSRVATTALKSLAPVQLIESEALRATGETDLRRALSVLSPSYINITSNGGALSKNVGGSSLRGLSGNHVLVLVNGKRRHGSSLINNSGGATLGSSAADLGHIPVSAVERIEVLTDGAAAQYGSDAIAGVINVILKSADNGGSADVSYGEYNHSVSKVGGLGDAGRTQTANLNSGFALGSDGGFLNLSLSWLDVGDSHTVGPWKQPTRPIWQLYADPNDPREATANRHVQENYEVAPIQESLNLAYNFELPLNDRLALYSFATYSDRDSRAKGSFRSETNGTANYITTPGGYSPTLQTKEEDAQLNLGLKGEHDSGWSWDAGLSYGRNKADIAVLDTINASFADLVPLSDMDAGNLTFNEGLLTLSAQKAFATGWFEAPLNLTVGSEYRHNNLKLGAGEYYSYAEGGYIFPNDYPAQNLRGQYAGAGSGFLTGFRPEYEFNESRNNKALYIDLAQQINPRWDSAVALRYEDYSDFGSAVSGKFSNRFALSSSLALRGTLSNGFRAPSLAEQYYRSTTVQPVNDPITNTSYISYNHDTLPYTDPAAQALGAKKLKAEKSTNLSVGLVFTPNSDLSASIDLYQIDIKDRIYLTGGFNGFNNAAVAQILANAGLSTLQQVKYFSNFGETRTRGLELKVDYRTRHGAWGNADWSLSYAHNKNSVEKVKTPAVLANAGLNLLGRDRIVLLEETLPQHIARAGVNWSLGRFQLQLTERYYSKTRSVNNINNPAQDSTTSDAFLTDVSLSYLITEQLKATLGANNVFNKKAPDQPASLASTINHEDPYANRNTPYGIGGGFYFARLSYDW